MGIRAALAKAGKTFVDTLAHESGYVKTEEVRQRLVSYVSAGWGSEVREPDPSLPYNQADLYRRLSWVYGAVGRVAESYASLANYQAFEANPGKESKEPILNHPWEQLLRHPNPYQFKSQFAYSEAVAGYLKLTGNCYIWMNALSTDYWPAELWVLRPDRVTIAPSTEKLIQGYIFNVDEHRLLFDAAEVIHIKLFHPLNDWYGLSAIEALALAAESDYNQALWNRNFFGKDNAKPQGALEFAEFYDDETWEQIKADVRTEMGGNNRRTMLIRGAGEKGVKWDQMALTQKDMEFLAGRQFSKEEIYSILAPGLVQMLDKNAVEANALAGEKTYREYTLYPLITRIGQQYTADVGPRYGDNIIIEAEDIRYRDRRLELDERTAYERTHTIDEVREKYDGDKPIGDERGQLLVAQITAQSGGIQEPPEPKQIVMPNGQPGQQDGQNSDKTAEQDGGKDNADKNQDKQDAKQDEQQGKEAKAQQQQHTGVMLAFAIPELVGKQLLEAVNASDALPAKAKLSALDELHLTLAYLGDSADLKFSQEELRVALKIFAAKHSALRGTIGGIGRMPAMDGMDQVALYALFDSPELPAFRESLVSTLKAAGIFPDETHGFVPHITLGYIPVDATEIPAELPSLPVQFRDVVLAWAGDWESVMLSTADEAKSLEAAKDRERKQFKSAKRLAERFKDPTRVMEFKFQFLSPEEQEQLLTGAQPSVTGQFFRVAPGTESGPRYP
jgi:HK97 family phage portal protein